MSNRPLTIVEMDVPYCTRVFGSAPCTAALSATTPRKCFNTLKTCGDPANYNAGTLTLRFAQNQTGLPAGMTVFPALQSVSTNPAAINLSGIGTESTALGTRARVTVNLLDFAYHDSLTDKYFRERKTGAAQDDGIGYDPARGTFFAKQLARNPYYLGNALRVLRGYVGDDLGDMETSHYVISEWQGPDAGGAVQITAKDILDLAENTKAVYPPVSNGKLLSPITAIAMTATLTPTGIGAEYPTSGRVCIGREIATYTRSGDTLTFDQRGVDGTTVAAHKINDAVQKCAYFDGTRICDTIETILQDGPGGVPTSYITTSEWRAEEDAWLGGLRVTATIPQPVGKKILVGELCQLGVMVWPDEGAQKIRFRANRPLAPGESIVTLTDNASFITSSAQEATTSRISALIFVHGMKDPTASATDPANFEKAAVATLADNPYDQASIKTVYSRWFGPNGDDAAASVIAERLVSRYQAVPTLLTATIDVKDRANTNLGDLIYAETRVIQDETGYSAPMLMQVNSVEPNGERLTIKAESYAIDGRFAFWMTDPQGSYNTATADEQRWGAFWMDDGIGTFDDGTGPFVYF